MTELSNDSHLQLTREHVSHVGFSMEEQLEAHVEPMTEEDVQPSFWLAIDEGQLRDHALELSCPFSNTLVTGCCYTIFTFLTKEEGPTLST